MSIEEQTSESFGSHRNSGCAILRDTNASMRGYDTQAENARNKMLIVIDHPDVGPSKSVHLCLTVISAIGRCVHELLMSARIVLH